MLKYLTQHWKYRDTIFWIPKLVPLILNSRGKIIKNKRAREIYNGMYWKWNDIISNNNPEFELNSKENQRIYIHHFHPNIIEEDEKEKKSPVLGVLPIMNLRLNHTDTKGVCRICISTTEWHNMCNNSISKS